LGLARQVASLETGFFELLFGAIERKFYSGDEVVIMVDASRCG
jgi:hypothetical protein